MDFLEQIDTLYIKFGLMIVILIGHFIVTRQNNIKLLLQYHVYAYGIIILLLSLSIPHVFSSFPQDISDLENKKRLLYHLQRNNEALSQTTQAIREMCLVTFLVLVSVISKIIKLFKIEKSVE